MKHFFTVYKALEHKDTAVTEVRERAQAVEIIRKAIESYRETFGQDQ
jgi:inorganic pyrophosphatase